MGELIRMICRRLRRESDIEIWTALSRRIGFAHQHNRQRIELQVQIQATQTLTNSAPEATEGATSNNVDGLVFVTNQELRLAERESLSNLWSDHIEIYHLERITAILDHPEMHSVRKQFIDIDPDPALGGVGGAGGSGTVIGNRSRIVGRRGGAGGVSGVGGAGGSGLAIGDDATIIGGDGGSAATADGRGGRGAPGGFEVDGGPTQLWPYGRGGHGKNHPEYDRRLGVLMLIREQYMSAFPDVVPFIDAGIDIVPVTWMNKRLEELNEPWRVQSGPNGYRLPALMD